MTKDSVNLKGQNDTNKQTNTQMFVAFKIQITHLKNSEVSETATFSHILGEVMTLYLKLSVFLVMLRIDSIAYFLQSDEI